jgi:hypothetical protein
MDKRIFVSGTNVVDISTITEYGDEILDLLSSAGYEICSSPDSKFMINFNHNSKAYKEFRKNGGSSTNAILIRLEPTAVHPIQYKKSVLQGYGMVISPGYSVDDGFNDIRVNFPYRYHKNPAVPVKEIRLLVDVVREEFKMVDFEEWQGRKYLATLIAANKVSATGNNYYGVRRDLAFKTSETGVSVFGPLWDSNLTSKIRHRLAVALYSLKSGIFPNLFSIYGDLHRKYKMVLGPVEDKHAILKQSKFNLVIENAPETISEKLFDALIAGTVPIYLGPKLSDFKLPNGLAIEYDGNVHKINKFLAEISEQEVMKMLKAGSVFIKSEEFVNDWYAGNVNREIAKIIENYVEVQL